MAGFDYVAGRSNNMVAAEARGMVTIGRWAKRFGVSAKAVRAVIKPGEAHHTGSGRVGRSRLTPVIDGDTRPTDAQLEKMRLIDAGEFTTHAGCTVRWLEFETIIGNYGKHLGKRPVEKIRRDATITIDPAGQVVGPGERLCGLVVLGADGELLAVERVNVAYESIESITARLLAQAVPA